MQSDNVLSSKPSQINKYQESKNYIETDAKVAEASKFCSNCGVKISEREGLKFCAFCGTKLN